MKRLFLALALALPLLIPGVASTQARSAQGGCSATIDGTNVAGHDSADNAIKVDAGESVPITLQVPGGVRGPVEIRIAAGTFERTLTASGSAGNRGVWSGEANASDEANLGVGLYKATLTTEGCELSAWIDIQGNPFTTVAGAAATAVLAAGLAIQAMGLVRGFRGRGGFKWALLGGIPTGLGACVLAQQFGATPLTPGWVATWTSPPVAVGGLLQGVVKMLGGGDAGATISPPEEAPVGGYSGGDRTDATGGRGVAAGAEEPVGAGGSSSPPPSAPPAVEAPGGDTGPEGSYRPTRGGGRITEGTAPPDSAAPGGDIGETAGGAADEVRDPPRSSFALLDCPDVAVAGAPFELSVGIAAEQQPGVTGMQLVRPATSIGDYVLTIQIVADGFTLAPGESWRHSLPVTVEAPHPSVRVHLTPEAQEAAIRPRAVQAVYSVNGHTMGLGVRAIAVVRSADLAADAPHPPADEGVEIAVPMDTPAADLTVRIQKAASQSGGKLMWTFDSPHQGMSLPDEPVVTDIGDEPEHFVRQLITGISVQEGRAGLHAYLSGVGITIADEMPVEFWTLFQEVARRARAESRPPSVFLLSEEPYVPWELATVDANFADARTPQFLGAQASVGRWVLGHRRPELPPPFEVDVKSMAVISGVYDQPGWSRLLDAEAEAAELCRLYGGQAVQAGPADVLRCLAGDPRADLLHFSLHGVYDPGSIANGLVLVDGSALDPFQVKGSMLEAAPFVFLNACQVGAGSRLLGDYAGMAEAFLYAGASGVIAPLWSISDTLARGVAQRFYEGAFTGTPPAEVLRQERGMFGEGTQSATALAYLYYGHPSLRLKRPAS